MSETEPGIERTIPLIADNRRLIIEAMRQLEDPAPMKQIARLASLTHDCTAANLVAMAGDGLVESERSSGRATLWKLVDKVRTIPADACDPSTVTPSPAPDDAQTIGAELVADLNKIAAALAENRPDIEAPAAVDEVVVSADAVVSEWITRHTDPQPEPEPESPLRCSILRALYRADRQVAELEEEARRIRARHEAAAKIARLLSEAVGGDMDEADEVLRRVAEIIGDVQ